MWFKHLLTRPVPSKTVLATALYSEQQGIEIHSLGSVSRGAHCSLGWWIRKFWHSLVLLHNNYHHKTEDRWWAESIVMITVWLCDNKPADCSRQYVITGVEVGVVALLSCPGPLLDDLYISVFRLEMFNTQRVPAKSLLRKLSWLFLPSISCFVCFLKWHILTDDWEIFSKLDTTLLQ